MLKIEKTFTKEIAVPDWGYCNLHDSDSDKVSSFICTYATIIEGAHYCKIFGDALYSHDYKIKKCEACLNACGRWDLSELGRG
jgi:hypothetical protein